MNSDLLDITETQARILRAIAYYEKETGEEGFAKYDCSSNKLPKKIRIAPSTMHDQMKLLVKLQMIIPLKKIKKGKRPAREPYAITEIGQIAWLRYFQLSDNIEMVSKLFPNILLSQVDIVINEHIKNKLFKDKIAIGILKIALDSIHVSDKINIIFPDKKLKISETIDLSGNNGLIKTSYRRSFNSPMQLWNETKEKNTEIGLVTRVTFLFYYNLIQTLSNESLSMINIQNIISEYVTPEEFVEAWKFSKSVRKIKNKITDIISENKEVIKIMKDNLEQLQEYNESDFQSISDRFLK